MRLIKMLGLAMVAAVAAMALLGAGSASATSTALCSADPTGATCNAGTLLSGLQNIDGLQILGVGTLLSSLGEIHCQNGHIKAHIPDASLKEGANATILGKINVFTYLECKSLLNGCNGLPATITTTVEPEFHLLNTGTGLGTLTILKPSTTVVVEKCPLIGTLTCKFAENDNVVGTVHNLHETVIGEGPKVLPVVLFKEAPITGPGGSLCPKSGKLDTSFELKYLEGSVEKPVFIAS